MSSVNFSSGVGLLVVGFKVLAVLGGMISFVWWCCVVELLCAHRCLVWRGGWICVLGRVWCLVCVFGLRVVTGLKWLLT